jgi:hypothetical protein
MASSYEDAMGQAETLGQCRVIRVVNLYYIIKSDILQIN